MSALLDHKVDDVLVTVLREIRVRQADSPGSSDLYSGLAVAAERRRAGRGLQGWSCSGRRAKGYAEEEEADNSCLHYKTAFGLFMKLFK